VYSGVSNETWTLLTLSLLAGANLAAFRFGLVYFQCTVAIPSGHLHQSRFAFCIRRGSRALVVIHSEAKVPRFVRKSHPSRCLLDVLAQSCLSVGRTTGRVQWRSAAIKSPQRPNRKAARDFLGAGRTKEIHDFVMAIISAGLGRLVPSRDTGDGRRMGAFSGSGFLQTLPVTLARRPHQAVAIA
jgi:hypothetical protein